MQTLGLVPRLFPEILAGRKTSTIRWREPEIMPGPMRYIVDGAPNQSVVVTVTRVTTMPLSQAAAFVGMAAEWPKEVMLAGMHEHYPTIEWDDLVEVIEHLPPAETA